MIRVPRQGIKCNRREAKKNCYTEIWKLLGIAFRNEELLSRQNSATVLVVGSIPRLISLTDDLDGQM